MCSGKKSSSAQELEPLKAAQSADMGAEGQAAYRSNMLRRGILSTFNRSGMMAAAGQGATSGSGAKLGG